MNDQDRRRESLAFARTMSAADISMLQGALAEPSGEQPVMLTTTSGSNNDELWSDMTELGWLSEAGALDAVPGSKLYAILATARPMIAQFLADLDQGAAMTRIINELREEIPQRLLEAVRAVDGTPADLAILVAGIVESTMRKSLKPELHDEFLREVAKVAEQMRSL